MSNEEGSVVAHARATDLSELPERMRALPVVKGLPVPYFVHVGDDGVPDHRIVDARKYGPAVKYRLCWVCGQPLGSIESYAVGPMCVINRISGEPGQHTDCSTWSARHCPFLTTPGRQRRESHMPGKISKEPLMSTDNPGVMAVWTTKRRPVGLATPNGSPVFRMAEPISVDWYTQGRPASPEEAATAFERGVERLIELSTADAISAGVELPEDWDDVIHSEADKARRFLP